VLFTGTFSRRGKSKVGPSTTPTYCMNINYLISILCLVMWIVALVDCLKSNTPNKLVWIIVIILLPFLGSILWFILGKSGRA
jgi:hypothetical protein